MADRENEKGNAGGPYGAEYPESAERSPGGYGEMAKGEAGSGSGREDQSDRETATDDDADEISSRQGGSSSGNRVSRSANPVAGGSGTTTPAPDPFHASPT